MFLVLEGIQYDVYVKEVLVCPIASCSQTSSVETMLLMDFPIESGEVRRCLDTKWSKSAVVVCYPLCDSSAPHDGFFYENARS